MKRSTPQVPHRAAARTPATKTPIAGDGLRVSQMTLAGSTFAVLSYPTDHSPGFPALTTAEREVVDRIIAGHDNASIARARHVSVRTVANQVASILRKLRLSSRAELVANAAKRKARRTRRRG